VKGKQLTLANACPTPEKPGLAAAKEPGPGPRGKGEDTLAVADGKQGGGGGPVRGKESEMRGKSRPNPKKSRLGGERKGIYPGANGKRQRKTFTRKQRSPSGKGGGKKRRKETGLHGGAPGE